MSKYRKKPVEVSPLLPRFGMRTLLLLMAAVSALFALFKYIDPAWSTMIGMLLVLLGLHVGAAYIGTKLRPGRADISPLPHPVAARAEASPVPHCVPPRQMHAADYFHWWWLLIAAAFGIVFAIGGGWGIAVLTGPKLTAAGLAVGAGSAGVVGGLLGFMVSSFFSVSRQALHEATEEVNRNHRDAGVFGWLWK